MNFNQREQIVFWLLIAFVCSWAFSEVYESIVRQNTAAEVHEFINKGARFTADDGAALEYRIHLLEDRVKALEDGE